MLTQGPAPDPKCKLNISSFLTLPHLSDSFICTRHPISIVLLLQMMGGWDRRGLVDLKEGVGKGDNGQGLSCSFCSCLFLLVLLSFALSCPLSLFLHDWSMVPTVSVSFLFISFLCLCSL